MNPRYTLLQSWEREAFNRYAQRNGFHSSLESAFWHTMGALLRGAQAQEQFACSHFPSAATRCRNGIVPLSPSVKIENRLYSLFAE